MSTAPRFAVRPRATGAAALTLLALLGACGSAVRGAGGEDRALPQRVGNAIVFSSHSFDGRTDVLQVLRGRISSLQIFHRGACPDVVFRGRSSLQGSSSAQVYVNGQIAVNTCVLEMVSPFDVERVEVYPSGIVSRPGYAVSGTGAILVFTKNGAEGGSDIN